MSTRGPWKPSLHGIDGPDGMPLLDVTASYDITFPDDDDLRLMAAAPDLLAALKELRDGAYGNPSYPEDTTARDARADAAIAKAEGHSLTEEEQRHLGRHRPDEQRQPDQRE